MKNLSRKLDTIDKAIVVILIIAYGIGAMRWGFGEYIYRIDPTTLPDELKSDASIANFINSSIRYKMADFYKFHLLNCCLGAGAALIMYKFINFSILLWAGHIIATSVIYFYTIKEFPGTQNTLDLSIAVLTPLIILMYALRFKEKYKMG